MGNIFNDDYRDFITCFNKCDVKYILVGGYSVILHGYTRTTGDMDLWVERTPENYKSIKTAFLHFGMPVFDMTEDAFLNNAAMDVFSFGRPPYSIDIMVEVKGMNFAYCYKNSKHIDVEGITIRTIIINDLIKAKKASGRPKDLDDLENLIP
jgi:hypothetical protein